MTDPRPRTVLRLELAPLPAAPVEGLRPPAPEDLEELGRLMYGAYLGTVDDEGGTEEQAVAEVRKTFAGEYGAFRPACSRLVERDGRILSATLVTRWQDRPFVAFSMTRPDAKRRGLARACMTECIRALLHEGETELRLVVTAANAPAVALYEGLGFRPERRSP